MVKPKRILWFLTAILISVSVFLYADSWGEEMLSFQVSSEDQTQEISLWKSETGCFYVFLPSYALMDQVQILLHTGKDISIDGVKLENGMRCENFQPDTSYDISYSVLGREKKKEIIFLRSANLGAMYIETASGIMDYIHKEKGNKEPGFMTLILPDGTISYHGKIDSIQGRGNSSWTASGKKPYSLNMTEEANLLNLGSAQRWILLANAFDASHMRNKVIYDFAARFGLAYSPDSDWVDLYLNGEYAGLYLLSERNEVHPERVNLPENGGILVSQELSDRIAERGYPHIVTGQEQYFRVHDPENLTSDQLQAIENIWQGAENAILAENGIDPVTGKSWQEWIDPDSWVRKYLVEEIFANLDACFLSQFFYCDGAETDLKIYAGPVWDYDHAFGSERAWQVASANALCASRYAVKDGFNTPWFYALYQKEAFHARMVEIYQTEALPLVEGFLYGHIASCAEQIADAFVLNQIRWNLEIQDLSEQVNDLRDFLDARIAFLNRLWIARQPCCVVKADSTMGDNYGYYGVFPGESLQKLPMLANTETWKFLGWYRSDTGEPFALAEPIYDNITICARWQIQPGVMLRRIIKWTPMLVLLLFLLVILVMNRKQRRRMWYEVVHWKDMFRS